MEIILIIAGLVVAALVIRWILNRPPTITAEMSALEIYNATCTNLNWSALFISTDLGEWKHKIKHRWFGEDYRETYWQGAVVTAVRAVGEGDLLLEFTTDLPGAEVSDFEEASEPICQFLGVLRCTNVRRTPHAHAIEMTFTNRPIKHEYGAVGAEIQGAQAEALDDTGLLVDESGRPVVPQSVVQPVVTPVPQPQAQPVTPPVPSTSTPQTRVLGDSSTENQQTRVLGDSSVPRTIPPTNRPSKLRSVPRPATTLLEALHSKLGAPKPTTVTLAEALARKVGKTSTETNSSAQTDTTTPTNAEDSPSRQSSTRKANSKVADVMGVPTDEPITLPSGGELAKRDPRKPPPPTREAVAKKYRDILIFLTTQSMATRHANFGELGLTEGDKFPHVAWEPADTGIKITMSTIPGKSFGSYKSACETLKMRFPYPRLHVEKDIGPYVHFYTNDVRPVWATPMLANVNEYPLPHTLKQAAKLPIISYFGEDINGNRIIVKHKKSPHMMLAGASGSGKTATFYALIMRQILSGSQVILLDPKGDYAAFRGAPNVTAVATTQQAHIAALAAYAQYEMDRRISEAATVEAKGGSRDAYISTLTPLFVFFDEIGLFRKGKKKLADPTLEAIDAILMGGRQLKVFCVLASQKTYNAHDVPKSMVGNIATKVLVGAPEDMKMLPDMMQDDELLKMAEPVAKGISPSEKGRATFASYDSSQGKKVAVEVQTPYVFAPGVDVANQPKMYHKNWRDTAELLNKMPRLHPRIWFDFDGVDMDEFEELRDVPVVTLDDEFGRPDPSKWEYDPMNPDTALSSTFKQREVR